MSDGIWKNKSSGEVVTAVKEKHYGREGWQITKKVTDAEGKPNEPYWLGHDDFMTNWAPADDAAMEAQSVLMGEVLTPDQLTSKMLQVMVKMHDEGNVPTGLEDPTVDKDFYEKLVRQAAIDCDADPDQIWEAIRPKTLADKEKGDEVEFPTQGQRAKFDSDIKKAEKKERARLKAAGQPVPDDDEGKVLASATAVVTKDGEVEVLANGQEKIHIQVLDFVGLCKELSEEKDMDARFEIAIFQGLAILAEGLRPDGLIYLAGVFADKAGKQ